MLFDSCGSLLRLEDEYRQILRTGPQAASWHLNQGTRQQSLDSEDSQQCGESRSCGADRKTMRACCLRLLAVYIWKRIRISLR